MSVPPHALQTDFKIGRVIESTYTGEGLRLSRDGRYMVSCVWGRVFLYDLALNNGAFSSYRIFKPPHYLDDADFVEEEDDRILSVAVDGRIGKIYTSSRGLLIRQYDIEQGICIRSWKGHEAAVLCMDVDSTGQYLVTGSSDSSLKLWDTRNAHCEGIFKGHGRIVTSVQISNDEGHRCEFYSGSEDGNIRIWDMNSHQCLAVCRGGHGNAITGLSLSPCGYYLVSVGRDNVANIWNLRQKKLERSVAVYENLESAVCVPLPSSFSNGEKKASGSSTSPCLGFGFWTAGVNGNLCLYDASSGQKLQEIDCKYSDKKYPLFPKIDDLILQRNEKEENGQLSYEKNEPEIILLEVLYDSTRNRIICAANDNMISIYDAESYRKLNHIIGHNQEVTDICFLGFPGGTSVNTVKVDPLFAGATKYLAVSTNSSMLRLYPLLQLDKEQNPASIFESTGALMVGQGPIIISGHSDSILCLNRTSNDVGEWLLSGAKDKYAILWRFISPTLYKEQTELYPLTSSATLSRKLEQVALCRGHAEAVGAVALSSMADGRTLMLITGSQDRTIKVWHYDYQMELSPSGANPVSLVARYTIKAHDKDINAIDCHPSGGKWIVTASQDKTAKVWRADNGVLLATLSGHKRGLWAARFGPIVQNIALYIVTSSADKTIKLWSTGSAWTCLKTFEGHSNSVLKVVPMNFGLQLVSSGSDGLIKVWDIAENECITTLDAHSDRVWSLAVSPDSRYVVSGGADAKIVFWDDNTLAVSLAKQELEKDSVLNEQAFANFIRAKDFKNALALALTKRQPYRLLSLFHQLSLHTSAPQHFHNPSNSFTKPTTLFYFSDEVDPLLKSLSQEDLAVILGFLKDWHTHSKNAYICHQLLHLIFSHYSKDFLLKIPSLLSILDALVPYAQRHYARLEEDMIQFYLVDYVLQSIQL